MKREIHAIDEAGYLFAVSDPRPIRGVYERWLDGTYDPAGVHILSDALIGDLRLLQFATPPSGQIFVEFGEVEPDPAVDKAGDFLERAGVYEMARSSASDRPAASPVSNADLRIRLYRCNPEYGRQHPEKCEEVGPDFFYVTAPLAEAIQWYRSLRGVVAHPAPRSEFIAELIDAIDASADVRAAIRSVR